MLGGQSHGTIRIFLLSILVMLFTQCNRKTKNVLTDDSHFNFELEAPFALGVSQKACNVSQNICISLDSVFEDSRCPTGVNCIWEGNANMRFQLQTAKTTYRFKLDTQPTSNFYQHDTIFEGYHIQLHELSPYPQENSRIKQTDYAVEISVHEVGK